MKVDRRPEVTCFFTSPFSQCHNLFPRRVHLLFATVKKVNILVNRRPFFFFIQRKLFFSGFNWKLVPLYYVTSSLSIWAKSEQVQKV